MKPLDNIEAAVCRVNDWLADRRPQTAIVLGSGWGGVLDRLEQSDSLAYDTLPGFPAVGVVGHSGRLHQGRLFGVDVLVFEGRYHYYEGYDAWQVTALVRLAAGCDCRGIVLTNAGGGIADRLSPGHFMLVTDHLNLTAVNPLIGRPEREFIDLGCLYESSFQEQLKVSLADADITLEPGVLAWMSGPAYETPAEIRALEALGADAVSMSTVPEAIVAGLMGLKVVGLSLVSNKAAGKGSERLNHDDVLLVGRQAEKDSTHLLQELFRLWSPRL